MESTNPHAKEHCHVVVCSTLARISAAALLVKVTARIAMRRCFVRPALTRQCDALILEFYHYQHPPVPTYYCSGAATASRCLSFNPSSNSETSIAKSNMRKLLGIIALKRQGFHQKPVYMSAVI